MRILRLAALTTLIFTIGVAFDSASAQQDSSKKPLTLVTSFGPGGIRLPNGPDWKPDVLTVYDHGRRPVAQMRKGESGLSVSFILFENLSGNPSAVGCRDDAIGPIIDKGAGSISKRVSAEEKNAAGETLATTTYLFDIPVAGGHHQRNLFGFAGNGTVCAEIHISSVDESQAEADRMRATFAEFEPELTYQPTAVDLFRMGQIFFKMSPELAGPYYKASLEALPNDARYLTARRVTTDQLAMSLGRSGDIKGSRTVAEKAIATDPDYAINYYNLACADAEQGNAANAKLHLQQAFDRRANVLRGESLPDPSQDDSILKLKKNKEFWAFVLALPKK